jgi:hypothetical protein
VRTVAEALAVKTLYVLVDGDPEGGPCERHFLNNLNRRRYGEQTS